LLVMQQRQCHNAASCSVLPCATFYPSPNDTFEYIPFLAVNCELVGLDEQQQFFYRLPPFPRSYYDNVASDIRPR